ncbi:hypothetical protein Avbf_03441 [Armadillidium vulgare]|nr:hypothetical protein Avbf_03441 [Armadillidium vulgare]
MQKYKTEKLKNRKLKMKTNDQSHLDTFLFYEDTSLVSVFFFFFIIIIF